MSAEQLLKQIKQLPPEEQRELANSILSQLALDAYEDEDDLDRFGLDVF